MHLIIKKKHSREDLIKKNFIFVKLFKIFGIQTQNQMKNQNQEATILGLHLNQNQILKKLYQYILSFWIKFSLQHFPFYHFY